MVLAHPERVDALIVQNPVAHNEGLGAIWATRGSERAKKLLKAVGEFRHSIESNRDAIPNYGDRHRHGERVSTAFAESTVNQVISKRMVQKQQMGWTERGAHLLLQVRTQVLNDDLRATFERWYPGM